MRSRAMVLGVSGVLAVALGCSESTSPTNRSLGKPRLDVTWNSTNGTLGASGNLIIKGFDGGNPRQGDAIIATFALDGPEKCSGLPVARYDAASLAQTLGSGFLPVHTQRHEHATPWGSHQVFQFSVFRREG